MSQIEAVGARPVSLRAASVAVLIPVGWCAAMGLSRRGNASLTMAVAVGALLVVVLFARVLERKTLVFTPRALVTGLVAAAVMIVATYAGFAVTARAFPALVSQTAALYRHLDAIALVLAVVVGEELLWRGAFHTVVGHRIRRPVVTVLLASAVYALSLASFGSPLLVAIGFACGVYWAALREWSGSVIPPLVAHVVWDLALALFPLRG